MQEERLVCLLEMQSRDQQLFDVHSGTTVTEKEMKRPLMITRRMLRWNTFFVIQNLFRKTNMLFDVNTVQIFLLVLVLPG
jgi:hypothetical protein